jgi:hypothetical protein
VFYHENGVSASYHSLSMSLLGFSSKYHSLVFGSYFIFSDLAVSRYCWNSGLLTYFVSLTYTLSSLSSTCTGRLLKAFYFLYFCLYNGFFISSFFSLLRALFSFLLQLFSLLLLVQLPSLIQTSSLLALPCPRRILLGAARQTLHMKVRSL